MRKFNYDSYLFIHQKTKKTPLNVKPNLTLAPTFFKKSVQIHNGINFFTIDNINKKHLNFKIGTFVNTRKLKK